MERQPSATKIDSIIQEEFIEPETTKRADPPVFAPKKEGFLRFCVDYWEPNAVTIREPYLLHRRNDCVNLLCDVCIFLTADAKSRYCEVEVDAQDSNKTASKSHHSLYQIARMPVDLKRPHHLPKEDGHHISVSIMAISTSIPTRHLRIFENHLWSSNPPPKVTDTTSKCRRDVQIEMLSFFAETINYLVHIIWSGRLEITETTTNKLAYCKIMRHRREYDHPWASANVFRRLLPSLFRTAAPLNIKKRNDQQKTFTKLTTEEELSADDL